MPNYDRLCTVILLKVLIVSQGKEIQKHSVGLVKNDYAVHNSKDILFSNQEIPD